MRRLYTLGIIFLLVTAGCLGGAEKGEEMATGTQPTSGMTGQKGKAIYDANCRMCHGPDGKGVQGTGAADLTASTLSKAQIISQVTDGGKQMPSFKDALSGEEIEEVAEYVMTLR